MDDVKFGSHLNTEGMGLLEVVVAMGLAGILLAGLMATTTLMTKMQSSMQNNTDFNTLINYANAILSNSDSCTRAFNSQTINLYYYPTPGPTANPSPSVINIYDYNVGSAPASQPVFIYGTGGTPYGTIKIQSLQLALTDAYNLVYPGSNPLPYPAPLTLHGQLTVTAQKNAIAMAVGQNLVYQTLLTLQVDPVTSSILGCTAMRLGTGGQSLPTCPPGWALYSSDGAHLSCKRAVCLYPLEAMLDPSGIVTCVPSSP